MSTPTIERPAQILLPFAEKEWISVERTMRILGIGETTFYRLREDLDEAGQPRLEVLQYGPALRCRVKYSSLVHYCDSLRERYHIPDRRPPLTSTILRHRDEDLLPFPLRDTIGTLQAQVCSGYSLPSVIRMIEQGSFEAYQIRPVTGSHWRISRSSFAAWIERALRPSGPHSPSTTRRP